MSQFVKTKRQANFKDFKRFGDKEQKKRCTYSTCSCANWASLKRE
jgi:hypothetical protein